MLVAAVALVSVFVNATPGTVNMTGEVGAINVNGVTPHDAAVTRRWLRCVDSAGIDDASGNKRRARMNNNTLINPFPIVIDYYHCVCGSGGVVVVSIQGEQSGFDHQYRVGLEEARRIRNEPVKLKMTPPSAVAQSGV